MEILLCYENIIIIEEPEDQLQGRLYIICVTASRVGKEKEIILKYKEIQMGSVAKSYMRKGFLCANI